MNEFSENDHIKFWKGDFGDEYTIRNSIGENVLKSRLMMWPRILRSIQGSFPISILEVGSNVGVNLRVLRLLTDARLLALEPNASARRALRDDNVVAPNDIIDGTATNISLPDGAAEMVFTSGVLIHIAPNDLEASLREIYRVSSKYIICIEYFSDKLEAVEYRGERDKLFKRDFGAAYLDNFPDLTVIDYGFFWKRITGLDNLTWWIFRK